MYRLAVDTEDNVAAAKILALDLPCRPQPRLGRGTSGNHIPDQDTIVDAERLTDLIAGGLDAEARARSFAMTDEFRHRVVHGIHRNRETDACRCPRRAVDRG